MNNRMLRGLLYEPAARVDKALAIDRFAFLLVDTPTHADPVQRKAP